MEVNTQPWVVLVAAERDAINRDKFGTINIAATVTPKEVILQLGLVQPPAEIVVVDMRAGEKQEVIVCGLLLRNAGRTVIVCDPQEMPVDLIRDLYNFSVSEKAAGRRIRTEMLLTESAMAFLGDVSDLVGEFETKFLGGSESLQ
jgi:hypothetical protein